jgi:hypothetical protein
MYDKLIAQATGETDPLRLALIEDVMRGDNGSVLDHLDRVRFGNEARIARDVLDLMKIEMPELHESLTQRVAQTLR